MQPPGRVTEPEQVISQDRIGPGQAVYQVGMLGMWSATVGYPGPSSCPV